MPVKKATQATPSEEVAPPTVVAEVLPEVPDVAPSMKPSTKWVNLVKLKAKPAYIESKSYKPIHRFDESSHTRIPLKAQNMYDLIDKTGGGFRMQLKPATSGWGGWMDLQHLGAECVDFRCGVCGKREPLNPVLIAEHFKPHKSGLTGRNIQGGTFYLTLSKVRRPDPERDEMDEDIDVSYLVA